MKFAVAFAAFVAVAVASPFLAPTDSGIAELEAIIAAIQSPNTDPATAALLEQQLAEVIAALNPVVVDESSPISIGPAIIDFPIHDGGALTPGLTPVHDGGALTPGLTPVEAPIAPAPAVIAEEVQTGSPLVQIILNIKQAGSPVAPAPVAPAPVETPVAVAPVNVVDEAVNVETPVAVAPVNVVDEAVNVETPVAVAPIVIVEPDQVAAPAPVEVEVEPIQVGTPILPIPVVPAPEVLN